MALLLYRLGHFCARHRWAVIGTWLALIVAIAGAGAALGGKTVETFSIPGTESQQAIDVLSKRMPGSEGASGRIVFADPDGTIASDSSKAAITAALDEVRDEPHVISVTDPFEASLVSEDGNVALAQVQWDQEVVDLKPAQVEHLQEVARAAAGDGRAVEFGGDAIVQEQAGGAAEAIGFLVAAVVLAITFGSLVSAGLPLLTAMVGVAVGILGITVMSAFFDLSSTVPTLALMLGLAVGIDYALFVLSRHRTQLFQGVEVRESIARAVGTAGSAVVFAGITVVVALAGLTVVGIPFLAQMGLAAAGTVLFAVLVALTLLPALLSLAGMRLAKGKNFETGRRSLKPTMGSRWGTFVTRHRVVMLVVPIIALGVIAVPALDMRLALPNDSTAATDSTNRRAYDLLSEGFGPGFNGPLMVVVDAGAGGDVASAAEAVGAELADFRDVTSVAPAVVNEAGDTAIISVTPSSGPSAEATKDLVDAIRGSRSLEAAGGDANVLVTGATATQLDFSTKMSDALLPYLGVIVVIALVLLVIAFRSIIVPLKAIGGFLLTIVATLGALTFVFQQGHLADLFGVGQPGPIMSMLPILLIGILFGLAMDYEVFLVSRMREEFVHGAQPLVAVREGFRHGARVVTAAAFIMIAVFAGFILESDPIIKSIGFALAFGILVDAFVVRMTIVPAAMALLGGRAWWFPRWIDKVTPRVDIEGETLRAHIGLTEVPGEPVEAAEDVHDRTHA